MKIKNCKRCKKAFTAPINSAEFCPACMKKSLNEIQSLTTLINDNNDITLSELSSTTSISEKVILKHLHNRKIPVFQEAISKCKRCGMDITSGIFCGNCLITMAKQ